MVMERLSRVPPPVFRTFRATVVVAAAACFFYVNTFFGIGCR
jgi:hypothetical protein